MTKGLNAVGLYASWDIRMPPYIEEKASQGIFDPWIEALMVLFPWIKVRQRKDDLLTIFLTLFNRVDPSWLIIFPILSNRQLFLDWKRSLIDIMASHFMRWSLLYLFLFLLLIFLYWPHQILNWFSNLSFPFLLWFYFHQGCFLFCVFSENSHQSK